jgi:hypothetical protein
MTRTTTSGRKFTTGKTRTSITAMNGGGGLSRSLAMPRTGLLLFSIRVMVVMEEISKIDSIGKRYHRILEYGVWGTALC